MSRLSKEIARCLRCKMRPRRSDHHNTKWCRRCRRHLLSNPKGTLTKDQKKMALSLVGKMPREEIAQEIGGVSIANLKRSLPGVSFAFHNKYCINQGLVRDVCRSYEKNGRKKTEQAFPNVRVRSIVERYKFFKPRRIRWKDSQIIELVKMAGIVSFKDQARYFKRPNAFEGSIKSFWIKRMGFGGGSIHGMSNWMAKEIVTDKCPRMNLPHSRKKICLWADMQDHLKIGVPKFICDAVKMLAHFQGWIFANEQPKIAIYKISKERRGRENVGVS